MEGTNERYVSVDGLRTRYLLRGSGPPLLLVHGLGEFLEAWLSNIVPLSEYFTVYAIDLPGHGLSEDSKHDCTLGFNVQFIINFMEVMGIPRARLIGHSMGGPICLSLAVDFPGKVDKLILVDSGGFSDKVSLTYRLATLPLLGNILLGPSLLMNRTTIRAGMKRQFYNPKIVPEEWFYAACQHLKRPKRNKTMLNIIRSYTSIGGIRPEANITDKLPLMKQPTLIIHGMQDRVIPIEHACKARKLIPHAKLEVFSECGHNPQVEKAPEFNETVLRFLTSEEA